MQQLSNWLGCAGHEETSRRLGTAEAELLAVRQEMSAARQQLSVFEAASAGEASASLWITDAVYSYRGSLSRQLMATAQGCVPLI